MSKYKEFFISQISKSLPQKFTETLQSSPHNAKRVLYELLSSVIHHETTVEVFFSIFDTLYKDHSLFISSIIIDLLWLSGFSFFQDKDDKKPKGEDLELKAFTQIVNGLLAKKIINKNSLIEKLEESTLSLCGIVPDLNSFRAKITRINTEHFYEQKKYNLLREESEGFSKLIGILFSFDNLVIRTQREIELILDKIICLIGFFDLDPTRVVDLVIEAFIVFPFNTNFFWIFNVINAKALPHIIGFKLEKNEIKDNMYIVIAQFIKYGLVSIQDIIQHLKPSFNEMEMINSSSVDKVMAYSKNGLIDRISNELRANNALMSIDESNSNGNNSNGNTMMMPNMTKQAASNFCSFNEVVLEAISNDDNNQLLKLLNGLIRVKDKYHSELIYRIIRDYYDPIQSRTLSHSLTELVSWMIKGLYDQYQNNPWRNNNIEMDNNEDSISLPFILKEKDSYNECKSFEEMMINLPQVMKLLGIGLAYNQILFQKILIIMSKQSQSTLMTHESIITTLMTEHFFPCLSLIDPTPSLVNLIWKIISQYEYNKRYSMYNEWHSKAYTIHSLLYLKYIVVSREITKWQKALSKENQRQQGRILGIISNSNPLLVFDNIIRLLTSYENQISIFMQTLSFCSSLSYDVITFIICKIIADPNREKIDIKSCAINPWFKNFVFFIGCFYKKYHTAEINGLLIYIFGKFKQETIGIEIYALKELIEKMSGIQTQELFSECNFLAECGGIHLYLEYINLNRDFKYFKRPTQVLLKFFTQENNESNSRGDVLPFTLSILTLFLIKKRNIIFSNRETSVKLISFLYDQFQYIFIQLLTFLHFYADKDFFNKLFLNVSPEKLINQYYINPMDVFQLLRTTLKPIYTLTEQEYQSNISYFASLFNQYQQNITTSLKSQVESSYIEKDSLIEDIYKPIWKYISPELYYIFNVLDLKDIFFPMAQYESELEKNEKEKERLAISMNDETDSKTRKEYEKLILTLENLQKEIKLYKTHSEQVLELLAKKGSLLDLISQINKKNIPQYLIQYLFYPRLILSKKDAIYTAQILSILISLKIPMLNVFDLLRKVFKSIIPCILCVSECEALNIGYFFSELFKLIKQWQEEKYWNCKCSNNPCFSRSLDVIQTVELSDFKMAIVCILKQMTGTFQLIFDSDNYINCRNAISVLSLITAYYPSTKESANAIIASIDKSLPKFKEYEDSIIMKRYMDNLKVKLVNLHNENEIGNNSTTQYVSSNNVPGSNKLVSSLDKHEKSYSTDKEKNNKKDRSRDKEHTTRERERDRDRERERDRERDKEKDKRKDDSNRNTDLKRRSPDDYNKKRNK